jgi:hypothetical protein
LPLKIVGTDIFENQKMALLGAEYSTFIIYERLIDWQGRKVILSYTDTWYFYCRTWKFEYLENMVLF